MDAANYLEYRSFLKSLLKLSYSNIIIQGYKIVFVASRYHVTHDAMDMLTR